MNSYSYYYDKIKEIEEKAADMGEIDNIAKSLSEMMDKDVDSYTLCVFLCGLSNKIDRIETARRSTWASAWKLLGEAKKDAAEETIQMEKAEWETNDNTL